MNAGSRPFWVVPSEFLSLVPPFVWGRPTTILNNVIYSAASTPSSRSSLGGLARLDHSMHNYRDNLGSLYCHPDDATAHVYEDEVKQVHQKILRYLDMRVMDGDLVVPTCLRMPTLILPTGRFLVMYYDPDAQGQYTSQFPTGGQGFMQPRGDIRTSIMPRNFRVLPADV